MELSKILVLLWKGRTTYDYYVLGAAEIGIRESSVNSVDDGVIIVVEE